MWKRRRLRGSSAYFSGTGFMLTFNIGLTWINSVQQNNISLLTTKNKVFILHPNLQLAHYNEIKRIDIQIAIISWPGTNSVLSNCFHFDTYSKQAVRQQYQPSPLIVSSPHIPHLPKHLTILNKFQARKQLINASFEKSMYLFILPFSYFQWKLVIKSNGISCSIT